ncbi:hypothetical protein HYT56_04300 [Candidatus Woesearchaeota archaeon]|nr:hypothetical protein [Candidatus Woesearchaeota archaeon]
MAKIFYIDDDELIRNLLARTFRSKHYDSEGFSNCEEALSRLEALASNQRPDLAC